MPTGCCGRWNASGARRGGYPTSSPARAASVVDDPQPDLSRAELKALLVIAYYQPVTHAEFGVILGREIPRERLAELRDLVAPGPARGAPHTFVTTQPSSSAGASTACPSSTGCATTVCSRKSPSCPEPRH